VKRMLAKVFVGMCVVRLWRSFVLVVVRQRNDWAKRGTMIIGPDLRWLGGFAVAVTLSPLSVGAQTIAPVSDEVQGTVNAAGIVGVIDSARQETIAASLYALSPQSPPQETSGRGLTRGQKTAIGALVGAGIGAAIGEYAFGRGLDLAHGAVLGGGIGAALGALIARARTGNESGGSKPKNSVTVVPLLSPSRKSLLVTLALR
jgi:hypothetical protein